MIKILFVCMGNICRSPTAEGVFAHTVANADLADVIQLDSAGTHAYHIGESPDTRSQAVALQRGYDLSQQRARRVDDGDFVKFDYILAMDDGNLSILQQNCPAEYQHKVHLFLDFSADKQTREVPDPYYGGANGFDHVLDLVEAAAEGLLVDIRAKHL
jgi:protein-tyrosine phosphatase